jgi:hypothetical protein
MTDASVGSTRGLEKAPEILGFYAWRGNWPVLFGAGFPRFREPVIGNATDIDPKVPAGSTR